MASVSRQIQVTKLEAARRQLETAITVYFAHGAPVSRHTLTAAAFSIPRDLNSKRGGRPMFAKDGFLQWIKSGHEPEVRKAINAAESFFKHADRDHDEKFSFNPYCSEIMLPDACGTYYKLCGEFPPLFRLCQSWHVANYPNHFQFDGADARRIKELVTSPLSLGRAGFFKEMLPVVMSLGIGSRNGA
jgi:hypothetical protein